MEGEFEWEGRLDVCFGQRWGTVGKDGWTETNKKIACHDLGYTVPETGLQIEIYMRATMLQQLVMQHINLYLMS